jgi:hypothetical protein
MLCKSGSSSHTEHNKIGFAIFGFFYELILNLQSTGPHSKTGKNLLALSPLGLLNLHNYALAFNTQALGDESLSQQCPPAAGQARRWRGRAGGGKQARGDGRLDSRVADSRWWLGRRGVRRWPTARQWQHGRRCSGCGELPAMLGHQVLLEAHVWAREELRVMGWS